MREYFPDSESVNRALHDLIGKFKKPKVEFIDEEFVGMWRDRDDMKNSSGWIRQVHQNEWRVRA